MISSFIISVCIITTIYSMLVIVMIYGWLLRAPKENESNTLSKAFSIIIPVRNEAKTIRSCIHSINCLNYPENLLEIIIVNDHSIDDTSSISKSSTCKFDIKYLELPEDTNGKKAALEYGILTSKNEYIITTDADCEFNSEWINAINNAINKSSAKMIIAPVQMNRIDNSFVQFFQELEFISLIGSGLSLCNLGHPIMSNGANLIFEKKSFFEVNGYNSNFKLASGDDVLLTSKFHKIYKNKVIALIDRRAIVTTSALSNIKSFISQRVRWASKTKYSKSIVSFIIGSIVICMNFSLLITFVLSLFFNSLVEFLIVQWSIKFVFDFLFIFLVASFMKKKRIMFYYPIVALVYPIYIFTIGILSIKGNFSWKGRTFINGQ